jgi:hypothetical protein
MTLDRKELSINEMIKKRNGLLLSASFFRDTEMENKLLIEATNLSLYLSIYYYNSKSLESYIDYFFSATNCLYYMQEYFAAYIFYNKLLRIPNIKNYYYYSQILEYYQDTSKIVFDMLKFKKISKQEILQQLVELSSQVVIDLSNDYLLSQNTEPDMQTFRERMIREITESDIQAFRERVIREIREETRNDECNE